MWKYIYIIVHTPDVNIDFFDIVAGFLLGDTLALFLRTQIDQKKENDFILKRQKAKDISPKVFLMRHYAGDLAFVANLSA